MIATDTGHATLALVVPTWNEAENIEPLYDRICSALDGRDWEMLFVDDDSADRTWARVEALSKRDPRVHLLRRIGRTGLASACLEGMSIVSAPYVAVLDADLQHDETLLGEMLETFHAHPETELVVASRKIGDASFGDMPRARVLISRLATTLTHLSIKSELSDPMSGFFMLRRELYLEVADRLYGQGFKLLLDICAAAGRTIALRELPYRMRARQAGKSKLGFQVILEFLVFLGSQLCGRLLPPRFLMFCLVGSSGVVVHMATLGIVHDLLGYSFTAGQLLALLAAMCSNFVLNNRFTFSDRSLEGRARLKGLGSFIVVCSLGAAIALAVGETLHELGVAWWLSGLASTIVGAVWNFSVSSTLTWRMKR